MIELSLIIAFLTSLISLILLRPIAIKYNLVDYPSERKNHTGNIPLVGGISIFLGMLISCFLFTEFDKFSSVLLTTSFLILIHGILDDLFNLNAKNKIAFQVFLSAIMIYFADIKLKSFGYLFGVLYPFDLGILSIPITIIAVIGLTNAINMIDGVDGLAVGISLIAIIGMICSNLALQSSPLYSILLAVTFALLPFFIFNITHHNKLKVFLGDGGSLFLGFIISWSLIYSAENIKNFTPSFALWCVAMPLFDFFAVLIIRTIKKQTLMTAKKDHIHHILENSGFSKIFILLTIVSFGVIFLLIGSFIENNFPALSFPIFLILFLFYLFIRIYKSFVKKVKRF